MADPVRATDDGTVQTVGSLVAEMRARLVSLLGTDAESGACELLAAVSDQPRHGHGWRATSR